MEGRDLGNTVTAIVCVQTMCNMLAASRHGEPAGGAPAKLSLADVVALAPLLPLNTAFQLLTKPLLDRGIGLRLKRTHVCNAGVSAT